MSNMDPEPLLVANSSRHAKPLLTAWSLADLRGTVFENSFKFYDDVTKWLREDSKVKFPNPSDLSGIENFLIPYARKFIHSNRAQEWFYEEYRSAIKKGMLEDDSGDTADINGSIFSMLMYGRQAGHFHAIRHEKYSAASRRIVIAYPTSNPDPNLIDGLKFRIYDVEDPLYRHRTKEIVGEPVSPQYEMYVPPGHVVMFVFEGDAVHEFEGSGLLTSVHMADVNSALDIYDENTAYWNGPSELEQKVEVAIRTGGTVPNPILKGGFHYVHSSHIASARRFIQEMADHYDEPDKLGTQEQLRVLREEFRNAFRANKNTDIPPGDDLKGGTDEVRNVGITNVATHDNGRASNSARDLALDLAA